MGREVGREGRVGGGALLLAGVAAVCCLKLHSWGLDEHRWGLHMTAAADTAEHAAAARCCSTALRCARSCGRAGAQASSPPTSVRGTLGRWKFSRSAQALLSGLPAGSPAAAHGVSGTRGGLKLRAWTASSFKLADQVWLCGQAFTRC